jgi:hypothetical protein
MDVEDLLARLLARELLDAPLIASLATLEADGSVHVVPIWYLWDGEAVQMATSSTSRKVRNLERDQRATVMIHDSPGRRRRSRRHACGTRRDPRGEAAGGAIHAIHLRYVTAKGLRLASVLEFLAGDDVILRFVPERGSCWDGSGSEAARELRECGAYADSSRAPR